MLGEPHPAFRIEGPALISFSGGRTSAFMLHEILRAHGGTLPDDVIVAFANTGRERKETLRFVHECGVRWGVHIRWVEWRDTPIGFEEVGYNSASRDGEPFAALIAKKRYLPNAVTRFCTIELKIRTLSRLGRSLGWDRWTNIVGLRYDEGRRVLKALARNDTGKERFVSAMPLSKAKVTKADVKRFWLGDNADPILLTHPLPQGFDLGLRDYEGNCDLCFLKSRGALCALMRENPGMPDWWILQEQMVKPSKPSGARFVTEYCYADLARAVADQAVMPGILDEEYDVECGLHCASDLEEFA
jgi:3'-phosphoadenosine 5'-phosphosulfate sulfotransferase (PAPS reductase)/FAD synthetase